MLLVRPMTIATQADARAALQYAIEIEHATIPPYLTALYSLIPGKNDAIYDLLSGIVVQEMQHMALAANMLNAIGGAPDIDTSGFVPKYPGALPFHIGDRNGAKFEVSLQAFSMDAVTNTFMRIEEPDEPLNFPVTTQLFALQQQSFRTIGDFYRDLRAKLQAQWFGGDPARQVSGFVKAIGSLADAQAAIDTIVAQGEGSSTSPLDGPGGEPGHYYRFAEISHGHALVKDTTVKAGFSYSGAAIPFDATGVLPIITNANSSRYGQNTVARVQSDLFNEIYSNLLGALHLVFNGKPSELKSAVGLMFDLKIQAGKLMQIALGDGTNAAPCFEYVA
jgi:hypothetical protein